MPETPARDVFSPFRVGLDHVALACTDEAELGRVTGALKAAGVENTGIKTDETRGKKYVAFKDPDRIAWEFYTTGDTARRLERPTMRLELAGVSK